MIKLYYCTIAILHKNTIDEYCSIGITIRDKLGSGIPLVRISLTSSDFFRLSSRFNFDWSRCKLRSRGSFGTKLKRFKKSDDNCNCNNISFNKLARRQRREFSVFESSCHLPNCLSHTAEASHCPFNC